MSEPVCGEKMCKFYRGIRMLEETTIYYCKAFPNGIPDDIASGKIEHEEVVEGQEGSLLYARGMDPTLVKPYSHGNMVNRKLCGHDNLCSTIRDIYLKSDDAEIKLWCRFAMSMSKNMYDALTDYKRMLVERGVGVEKESRTDWQLRRKSLYRGVDGVSTSN